MLDDRWAAHIQLKYIDLWAVQQPPTCQFVIDLLIERRRLEIHLLTLLPDKLIIDQNGYTNYVNYMNLTISMRACILITWPVGCPL